jgi:uncharacterized protein YijF (DUF1287 family)
VSRFSRRTILAGAVVLAACGRVSAEARPASARARALIAAARRQIGVTLAYDPAYTALTYPDGDVTRSKGVCTDVLIRAYRDAFGRDLQREVHEDMAAHFASYPRRWSLRAPDRNIDHRRVPNLETFWTRQAASLPIPARASAWQPGDLFTMLIDGRLPHTGIVSDRLAANGNPLVIHNIGGGAREEDMLLAWKPTGRFRWRL